MQPFGYILGIILGLYNICIVHFFIVLIIFIKKKIKFKYKRYVNLFFKKNIIIVFMISSIISAVYVFNLNFDYEKMYKLDSKNIEIEAVVVSNKVKEEYVNKYVVKIKGTNRKLILYTRTELKYGQLVGIAGKYSKPDKDRNYKGFNYSEYLKSKKIYGTIYVDNYKITIKNDNCVNIFLNFCNDIKLRICSNLEEVLSNENAGLVEGLILGNKENMDGKLIENFRKSNLSHILAVSGAHVAYIIFGIRFIVKKLKLDKRFSCFLTIFFLIIFCGVTNFTPSVTRAVIMAIGYLISKIIFRKSDFLNNISISCLLILIFNPFEINDIGFRLSFLGTFGIYLFSNKCTVLLSKTCLKGKIIEIIALTLSVQIIIIPILMVQFNTFSLTFIISSFLVADLFGIIVIFSIIIIIISFISIDLAKIFAIVLNVVLFVLIKITEFCSAFDWLSFIVITPCLIEIFIYYLGVAFGNKILSIYINDVLRNWEKKLLKILKGIKIRYILIFICSLITLTIGVSCIIKKIPNNLKINMIDVGQR